MTSIDRTSDRSSGPTSGSPVPDDEQLARYLLGELSPDDEAAIDDALAEDALWGAVQRAEDDLIDRFARGRLEAARHQRVAERIATSARLRERLELHRDLGTIAARRRRPPRRRARGVVTAMAGAFAIAAVIVLVVARGGQPGPGGPDAVVALELVPTTRAGEIPVVRVPAHGELALSVVMDAEEAFPRYRLRITAGTAVAWTQDGVVAADGRLALRVPVASLANGVHQLEITGLGGAGDAVRLGLRSFRVER